MESFAHTVCSGYFSDVDGVVSFYLVEHIALNRLYVVFDVDIHVKDTKNETVICDESTSCL